MKIQSATFITSSPDLARCPPEQLPEYAFIGRSNVGKSSMINLITGRKALAKVSVTPGKTRLINFFDINGAWRLVDLPGYGYAKVSKAQRADFSDAVAGYIEGRASLAFIFVLIDSRHSPHRIDLDFIRWLDDCEVGYGLIFTKADKTSANEAVANREAFYKELAMIGCRVVPKYVITSSKTKLGKQELLTWLDRMMDTGNA